MIPLPFSKTRCLIRLPAQSQNNAIKASLARKEEEMTRLAIEIAKLKHRHAFLTNEQELLKDALSPIKKLPPEILQEIFVRCLPVAHNATMGAQKAPLLLCRVCHGWRELAHATPRLWTSIHIPLCHNSAAVPVPLPEDVLSWIARSKSLPLSISLHCYPPTYYSGVEQIKPYLDGIISVKGRWRSLFISYPTPEVLEYVFSDDTAFDSLEELLVDSTSFPIFDEGKPLSPKLHSLSLPINALMGTRLQADYGRLTRLGITCPQYGTSMGSYELSDIVEILLSVPLLRSLSISGFHTSFRIASSPFSHQTIHLPNLESLSITNYQPYAYVWEFLRALHTPLLRHWKYYLLASHDANLIKEHLNALRIFLSRLKEPLEELDLHIHSYGLEFRRVLGLLPGLKKLSVQKPLCSGPWFPRNRTMNNIGDFHLRCLMEDLHLNSESNSGQAPRTDEDTPPSNPSSNFCCPQLEVIKCICHGRSLSEYVLLDFLRARTGVGAKASEVAPLKKVDILVESPISDGLREQVRQILDGTGTLFHLLSAPPFGRLHRI
jgi:hypothetical protein